MLGRASFALLVGLDQGFVPSRVFRYCTVLHLYFKLGETNHSILNFGGQHNFRAGAFALSFSWVCNYSYMNTFFVQVE